MQTMVAAEIAADGLVAPRFRAVPMVPVRPARVAVRKFPFGRVLIELPRALWMAVDLVLICTGVVLGDRLFVWWGHEATTLGEYSLLLANIVAASSVLLAGSISGLYEQNTLWARSRIFVRCLITVCLAMLTAWLVLHLLMYSTLSRRSAATGAAFFLVAASTIRLLAHLAIRDVRRGLLVIGQGPLTGSIIRSVRRGTICGYRLIGVVVDDAADVAHRGESDIPVAGGISEIERLCTDADVADVIVAENAARNPAQLRAALTCLRLGCRVVDETTFYESAYGEVPVSHITPNWFLTADLKGQRQEHAVIKRLFDVVVAGVALVASLPVMAVVAAVIRLHDRGPALYRQTRVGQCGREFTLYKFRTMAGDAEAGGCAWAAANDPRATRIGRVLRLTRLDELPQLWNILRGDMSVVGPRPERPEFVGPLSSLIPFYDERHLIKPGLTGWAQINYPYCATMADARRKLQLDLYYIKNMSVELDLIILLRTLGTFFLGSR